MMQRIALTGLFLLLNFTIHSTGHAQEAAQKPEGAIVRFGTPAKNDKGELTIDRGIESVIFTADGTKVAAGTRDGLLHIYDIKGEKKSLRSRHTMERSAPSCARVPSHGSPLRTMG